VADAPPLRAERTGETVVLTFDRPGARNAIHRETMDAFESAISVIEADTSVRAVVLTGAGDFFVSGGDVREVTTLQEISRMRGLLARMEGLPVPVLAAVNGPAFGGGCEILVACDLRIAEEQATLAWKQIAMALTPGWGGTARLARLVGHGRATRLLLTGETVNARGALAIGLVDEVVPEGASLAAALDLARRVGAFSAFAVRQAKRSLHGDEPRAFAAAWESEDHREAVRAFVERRPAVWKGK